MSRLSNSKEKTVVAVDIQIPSIVVGKLMGVEPKCRSRFKDGYGSMNDKQLDLVHRSKEFQEALEVLCSAKFRPLKDVVDAQRCVVQETGWIDAAQPTRIVVLKPSPGKALDPPCFDEDGDAETRQVAKEITRQIRETFRNETLSSSDEYPVGNCEITSLSSTHSWRLVESPLSSSSFSAESSIYREAKKRISERWAKVSLNREKDFPMASTALGDMLAVPTASLERSRSVPEISLTSVSGTSKPQAALELTQQISFKSSWKVPSFFFFKNKKANKGKTDVSLYRNMSQLAMPSDLPPHQSISPGEQELLNQDQPSPVSVLHPPFEEEHVANEEGFGSKKPWSTQGEEMPLKSKLIDKSPPIGSIARVLSWEDEPSTDITKSDEDWYDFIKTLLTASGFTGSDPLMTRWHSPDSPLDISLRDKFANKELINRMTQRSNHKLVFDCVNAIITETTSTSARNSLVAGFDMMEHVWSEFKNRVVEDSNSLGAERAVRDDVVGKIWSNNLQQEVNSLGIEIEMLLLQELVEEAVFDLA